MPVYNEARTIEVAVKRVLGVTYPVDFELVIVNDGSSDGTAEALAAIDDVRARVITHERNRGKGAAIRTAAESASGDYMIICDADLEYSPEEIPGLLAPVIAGEAEVVYGTRTFGSHSSFSFWYVMGNKFVTTFANVLFNCYISDLETCFKLMPLELYRRLDIKSAGFGMEAEATGKLLRMGYRPYEIPISYRARGREQGKKITAWDGIEALWIILRMRVGRRPAALTK
ncbi:glycosyltransferase family 2 protein [Phytohabitans flavus]|uniref:Glycosyl transferase n=2 Tax=Phytohabitans flavus TaxID=1076124 RepID=A0A6F8XR55_9ACTN|nr:glycosyl transferase [Phytohabitans flavus]